MTRLIDLTQTLDPANRALLPPHLAAAAVVVSPKIEYFHPKEKGADEFCKYMGCTHDDLTDGEGWGAEILTDMSSHCGTHVDAPLHSASRIAGAPARTITDIDLGELYRPGLVLDVRPWAKPGEEITVAMLDAALAATGTTIKQGDAVLIRTGQERFTLKDAGYYQQPGMSRAGTLHLTGQGATILGTDAVGWDLPFGLMARKYQETKDRAVGRSQGHRRARGLHRAANYQPGRLAAERFHGGVLPHQAGQLQRRAGPCRRICGLIFKGDPPWP
jgi:kynurenine formamidase